MCGIRRAHRRDPRWPADQRATFHHRRTRQRTRYLARVDADEGCPEAAFDHSVRELDRILAPNWKDAREARGRHLLLSVLADILQKEIAERHSLHAVLF